MFSLQTRFAFHTISAWVMLVFILSLAPVFSLYADEADQDRARMALKSGQVAPLSKLLELIEATHPGEVLKVELEGRDDSRQDGSDRGEDFIYEIKILTPYGNLVKLKYDAKSLELLQVEGDDSTD